MENNLHWPRRFYRKYLARYLLMRKLKSRVLSAYFGYRYFQGLVSWRFQSFLYAIARNLPKKSQIQEASKSQIQEASKSQIQEASCVSRYFIPMVTIEEYCKDENLKTYELVTAESIVLTMPKVHPAQFQECLQMGSWTLQFPSVQAVEILNAEVMGKSDFVFAQSRCLHHGLYCWERDFTSEEMHGLLCVDVKSKLVTRYAKSGDVVIKLEKAISLVGGASTNYVHWLTETAPKLALIDEVDGLQDYPLIIDSGLHPNILESLDALNIHKREIVEIGRGRSCYVDKLISISPVAYAPFDYRQGFDFKRQSIDPSWAMFVPCALYALRERLLSRMEVCGVEGFGRRIYIRRNSQIRPMLNAGQVEAMFSELGFQVVEPEYLSFAEQVKLFSTAEIIVAQAGAALGNIIFAPRGCRVVILSTWSSYSIYYYFSNIASILEQECAYIMGEREDRDCKHQAHSAVKVDIQALRKVIDE